MKSASRKFNRLITRNALDHNTIIRKAFNLPRSNFKQVIEGVSVQWQLVANSIRAIFHEKAVVECKRALVNNLCHQSFLVPSDGASNTGVPSAGSPTSNMLLR